MILTLADVKTSVARVLGANTDSPIVAEYVSRAQERLLYKAKWVGSYGRYRVCIQDSCLTWPREIETIEAAAVCNIPVDIRNDWYEFLGSGPGVFSNNCSDGTPWCNNCGFANQLIDRGNAVAFDDIKGTGKKIALYADSPADEGALVLIRYYDSTGNKVYSTDADGQPIEGEYLALVDPTDPTDYVYSSSEVLPGGFYGIIKPVTKRMVRAYEFTVSDSSLRPLGYYEPDETNPTYRRSLVPAIANTCCGASEDSCSTQTIDIVGKFRQRIVRKDNDALILQSVEAIRMMVQAIFKEEDNLWDDAYKYETRAKAILDEQLAHWMGDGKVAPMRFVGSEIGGGGVLNLI